MRSPSLKCGIERVLHGARTESVLGVLQQFEDEVHAVVVQPSGQRPKFLAPLCRSSPVLLANCLVVGCHRRSLSVGHLFDAKFAQVCTFVEYYDDITGVRLKPEQIQLSSGVEHFRALLP